MGYFRNGRPREGHLIYFNGEEYIGDFQGGEFSGNGSFYYSGKKYVGQWSKAGCKAKQCLQFRWPFGWSGNWTAGRKQSPADSAIASSAPELPKQASQMSPTATHRVRLLQTHLIRLASFRVVLTEFLGRYKIGNAQTDLRLACDSSHDLNTMDYTDQGDLQAAETVKAYIAKPLGQCKINGHAYSLCFT